VAGPWNKLRLAKLVGQKIGQDEKAIEMPPYSKDEENIFRSASTVTIGL